MDPRPPHHDSHPTANGLPRTLVLTNVDCCDASIPAAVTTEGDEGKPNNSNNFDLNQRNLPSPATSPHSNRDENEPQCQFCHNSPCVLEQGLYEELVLACELGLDPTDLTTLTTNREIRFRLYRYATNWIHDYLGKGNRRKLPQCVQTEIRDLAPESTGIYVGFKKRRVNYGPNSEEGN
jgi:hypothetical protein